MKFFLLFLILISSVSAENSWIKDPEKALKLAKEKSQPVLIDFYAEWCGPCKMMDKTTLKDEKVLEQLKPFVLLKVDGDKFQDLVKDYEVSGYPTFIILNVHSEKLAVTSGYKDSTSFIKWIETYSKSATSGESLAKLNQSDFKLLEMLKNQQNTKAAFEAISSQIFQNNYKKNKLIVELNKMTREKPQIFLEMLNHESLTCRLVASHIYVDIYKSKFKYDPWAEKSQRLEQIDKFKGSLK